ncbi:MAG: FMN-binding protein [Christensenellales bacterium]
MTGFAPFKVEVTVDSNGKIVSVVVPGEQRDRRLQADLIADQSVFDALVGQDIATAQIDVKAGATLTSNAINDALAQAAASGETEGSARPMT